MALQDLIRILRTGWRVVVSHGRSYGCLPEDTSEKIETPASNRPETANSVEKDGPLR